MTKIMNDILGTLYIICFYLFWRYTTVTVSFLNKVYKYCLCIHFIQVCWNIDLKQTNWASFFSNQWRIISVTHKISQWQNNCPDGLLTKEEARKKNYMTVQAGEYTFSNISTATNNHDDRTWIAVLKSKRIFPLRYIYLDTQIKKFN